MKAIRVYPSYHGYGLDSPEFTRLLQLADADPCLVQLIVSLEDLRTQPTMLRVNDVDLSPLPSVLSTVPNAKVQLLHHRLRGGLLSKLSSFRNLYFDTARVDGTDGVAELAQQVDVTRVLFSSHAPFFVPEAALIRVHESGRLSDIELQKIYGGNAASLLRRSHS